MTDCKICIHKDVCKYIDKSNRHKEKEANSPLVVTVECTMFRAGV